jgi:RNA-splicing ligase RtcB
MITLKGKYNTALVMIDVIDETTKIQIEGFLNHPAFAHSFIVIMPDCHAGAGSVIGTTMKMNAYIIPNVVGVDIGCGVLTINLGKLEINLKELDDFIKKNIPSGFAHRQIPLLDEGILEMIDTCFVGRMANSLGRIDEDFEKVLCQLGTLGGGNHFIEIDEDTSENKWLTIHTGSRNFGLKIAKYHQKIAKEKLESYFIESELYKGLEYLPLDSLEGQDYINDMKTAQRFAQLNRDCIANEIISGFFKQSFGSQYKIESIHNYINFEDKIIRKGAIQANIGQRLIIPFNMRDGVAVCTGKGNSKWNNSAPHGAGRIMSRTRAKKELQLDMFKREMDGIYTTTADQGTIDESPMAYKDKDLIIEAVKETVSIDFLIKPIYNFKAGGE